MKPLSQSGRVFIGLVILVGLLAVVMTAIQPGERFTVRFLCYTAVALLSSGLKVSLPGVTGTMSVSFLFVLTAIAELTPGQAMALALGSAAVQIFWKAKVRPALHQVLFNLAVIALAVTFAVLAFHSRLAEALGGSISVRLLLATGSYFLGNTVPIAVAIASTEKRNLLSIWKECYFWAFPYYLLAATIAGIINWVNLNLGWEFSLLAVPIVWFLGYSYRLYIGRLEAEKAHVEQMNGLHLRTIEALTLAIEAKDHTTRSHLHRVQHYAVEIGKELGLEQPELDALRAASLLHDIGKLAVPEHIVAKPGKLTPQEFEKMKIHPLVGAEILEQVDFPYPVAPIVRAHHERWDGKGYPHGLKTVRIPMGARILSAVDCLDALASDRPYRKALSLDEAIAHVVSESGKSYDPRVVEVLKRRYKQLELELAQTNASPNQTSVADQAEKDRARPVGPEAVESGTDEKEGYQSQIAAAGREAQNLLELVSELGSSLSLSEMLSVMSARLTQLVPCEAIAVFELKDNSLIPIYADGQDRMLFSSLEIPLGEGLSGWVAKHKESIFNGNPAVEFGYTNDPTKYTLLHSALVVPLIGSTGLVGVLALYRSEADSFSKDHSRILSGINTKVGLSLENALRYRAMEASATTDYLTGLHNTRSLFERLHHELARCKRDRLPLTVMVCDLDGFKQVNDRFGHSAGNQILQTFATGLKELGRQYDIMARFGGDEFVLVFPEMKPETVNKKTQTLSRLAIETGRQVCGETITAVSVGVACFPEDGATPDELLTEADRRMYASKKARKRNPAALFSTEPTETPSPKEETHAIR